MSSIQTDPDKIKGLSKLLERYGKDIHSSYKGQIRNVERVVGSAASKYHEYSSVTSKVREIQGLLRELEKYADQIEDKSYRLAKGLNDAVSMYKTSEGNAKKEADLSRASLNNTVLNTRVRQVQRHLTAVPKITDTNAFTVNSAEVNDVNSIADLIDHGMDIIQDKLQHITDWVEDFNSHLPILAYEIKKKLDELDDWLDDKAKTIVEEINGILDNMVTVTVNSLEKITQLTVSLKEKMKSNIEFAKEILKVGGEKLGNKALADRVNALIDKKIEVFNEEIEEALQLSEQFKETMWDKAQQLKSKMSNLYEKFQNSAQDLFEEFKESIDKTEAFIGDKLTELTNSIVLAKVFSKQILEKIHMEIKKYQEDINKDFKELEESLGGDEQAKELTKALKNWLKDEGYITGHEGSLQEVLNKVAVELDGEEVVVETPTGKITLSGKMASGDKDIIINQEGVSGKIQQGGMKLTGEIGSEGSIRGEIGDSNDFSYVNANGEISVKITDFQTEEVSGQSRIFIDAPDNSTGIEVQMDTKGTKYKEGPYAEIGVTWEVKSQEPLPQEQEIPIEVPQLVPVEKKWYEKAWDGIIDTGAAVADWTYENKEEIAIGAAAAWVTVKVIAVVASGGTAAPILLVP